jgi:hypothetical protein
MDADSQWVPAANVLPTIRTMTGQTPPIGYRKLLEMAASARIPLERVHGRWGCNRENLPRVAEALDALRTA